MKKNGSSKHDDLGRKYAEKFELLLDQVRRPNGDRWKGTEIARATNGEVGGSYVSGLLRGYINRPGAERLETLARVIGFPVSYWHMEPEELRRVLNERHHGRHRYVQRYEDEAPSRPRGSEVADDGIFARGTLLKTLYENLMAWGMLERGVPPTNQEVVERSSGRLSEVEIAKIRRGESGGLTRIEAQALSDAMGVSVYYWHRDTAREELLDLNTVERIYQHENVAVLWRGEGFTGGQVRLLRTVAENLRRREEEED